MTESTETPAAAAPEKIQTPTENGTTETPPEETPEKATEEKEKETPPPKEMRAVVLTGFGGLKTVKILKKPEPTVGEGEVLIRVKAWWVFLNKYPHIIMLKSLSKLPNTEESI